jgi:hypothetical protein
MATIPGGIQISVANNVSTQTITDLSSLPTPDPNAIASGPPPARPR